MALQRKITPACALLALAALAVTAAPAGAAEPSDAQRALRSSLGDGGVVRLDPRTGTPRVVARRDGLLTGPSRRSSEDVALGYVRRNSAAFGLDRDDIAGLRLTRRSRSADGTEHLQWAQTYREIPGLTSGISASVTREGRLVNVVGAPRPDLAAPTTDPRLSAAQAGRLAVGATGSSGELGGRPRLVLFEEPGDARLAWRVLVLADDDHSYDVVIDARDGRLLRRRDLVLHAAGSVFENRPGAATGGSQQSVTFSNSTDDPANPDPWLTNFTRLEGDNALVYADVNDSGAADAAEHVAPSTSNGSSSIWDFPQVTFPAGGGRTCPAAGCTWNSSVGSSWSTNRGQVATQLFYFINRFHDHLHSDPAIAFGDSSANFEQQASAGSGGDRVRGEVDDGADPAGAATVPDCNHVNNANMTVFPEGTPPRMQTFLFTSACGDPGVHDVNAGDDAFVVYHEYGHGLSGRLVTDSGGWGALWSDQAGAMGEAWSDWYAMDYLVEQGLETDGAPNGDLPNTPYFGVKFRTESLDCPVGSAGPGCPGTFGAGAGGYTYGDFGKIIGGPEVHADGEIWGQTLWDLRKELLQTHPVDGLFRVRALVTDAMRLSPPEPSYLEMRDAILQADAARGFGDSSLIWSVFAARGMGVCASTSGPDDTAPKQNFQAPGATCASAPVGEVPPPPTSNPPPASTPTPTPPKPSAPSLTISGGAVTVDRSGRFSYRVRSVVGASGSVTLRPVTRTSRRAFGALRRSFTIPAGGRVTLRLRLRAAARRLLRKRRKLRVRVSVEVTARGVTTRSSAALSLRAGR